MYDFTTARRRYGIGAEKWAMLEEYGVDDPDVIPFSVADMDLLAAPEITQALHEAVDFGVYGYTAADDEYRAALADWMASRHGWTIRPEWITTAFGVVHGILQAIHAFTAPGDAVIYQTPSYPPFRTVTEASGRRLYANPLKRDENGRYALDFAGLEELCARPESKLLIFCSPHNPTGRVWTPEELRRVAELCRKHGVLVYSDEIHCDFVFSPHRHTPFAAVEENCLVGVSASKTFNLAGLTTASVLVSNPDLRARFLAAADGHTGSFNSYFGLAAAKAAYRQGGPWLDALLEHLRSNYEYVRQFLAQTFPSITVSPQEGTYLLWADFRSLGLEPMELKRFLREDARLFANEGYHFGPEGAGFERLVLACPHRYLQLALERLDQAAAHRGLPR